MAVTSAVFAPGMFAGDVLFGALVFLRRCVPGLVLAGVIFRRSRRWQPGRQGQSRNQTQQKTLHDSFHLVHLNFRACTGWS